MAFSGAFQRSAFQRGAFQMDAAETHGGIGHYLEELVRLRQLAAITRRAPLPLMREARPHPAMPPAQASQVEDTQTIVADALALQLTARIASRAQRAAQRQRDEAEVLLLTP